MTSVEQQQHPQEAPSCSGNLLPDVELRNTVFKLEAVWHPEQDRRTAFRNS